MAHFDFDKHARRTLNFKGMCSGPSVRLFAFLIAISFNLASSPKRHGLLSPFHR